MLERFNPRGAWGHSYEDDCLWKIIRSGESFSLRNSLLIARKFDQLYRRDSDDIEYAIEKQIESPIFDANDYDEGTFVEIDYERLTNTNDFETEQYARIGMVFDLSEIIPRHNKVVLDLLTAVSEGRYVMIEPGIEIGKAEHIRIANSLTGPIESIVRVENIYIVNFEGER